MPGVVFPEGPAFFRGTRKVRERVGERVGEKDCTVAGMDPFLTIWHGNIGKKFDLAVWHRQIEYNPAG